MHRLTPLLLILNILPLVCPAQTPGPIPAEAIQGLYEGTVKSIGVEARLIDQGRGDYHLLLRLQSLPGTAGCSLLAGKTEGNVIHFTGAAWSGTYDSGVISLTSSQGESCQLNRVQRHSPTLGKQPPPGATIYLDGKSLANLRHTQGAKQPATDTTYEPDGSYKIPEHGIDSASYPPDFQYDAHIEFNIPLNPTGHGWARNSGWFFLPNMTKISIVDSFGEPGGFSLLPAKEQERLLKLNPSAATTFKGSVLGGIYACKDPDQMETLDSQKPGAADNLYPLAALPPGEWQTLDLEYRLPSTGNPHLTAYLNGIKIHDNAELDLPPRKGVFHFRPGQVYWRNFWVLPIVNK